MKGQNNKYRKIGYVIYSPANKKIESHYSKRKKDAVALLSLYKGVKNGTYFDGSILSVYIKK